MDQTVRRDVDSMPLPTSPTAVNLGHLSPYPAKGMAFVQTVFAEPDPCPSPSDSGRPRVYPGLNSGTVGHDRRSKQTEQERSRFIGIVS